MNQFLEMMRGAGTAGVFAWLGLTKEDEANARTALEQTSAKIERLRQQRDALDPSKGLTNKLNDIIFGDVGDLDKQIKVLQAREDALRKLVNAQFIGREGDKPQAPPPPGGGGRRTGSVAKSLKEQTTEAQRYLEQLEKQLQGTQELTAAETALLEVLELKQKANSGITPELEKQIFLTAQQIDAAKQQKRLDDEARRAGEEAARARDQAISAAQREVESIQQGNEQLQEQIAFLRGGEEAVNRMTDAKLQAVIADKEAALAAIEYNDANKELIGITAEQIRLLKERQALIGDVRMAKQLAKDAEAAKQFNDIFASSFADAFTSIIDGTKSVSEAFKDMEKQIVAAISRIAAQGIAEQIFGKSEAGGFGSFFAKLFGMTGGGGSFGGAGASGFFGGDIFGGLANGTNYWRGGPTVVGERGPEIVNLPKGAQVIPNSALQAKRSERTSVNIYQSFAPGTDRKTVGQAAAAAGKSVRRGLERYA